ncbi:LysR family transcriptional regulator [Bacterioplanoides sp. SCSIO 12839]|uniref:LysR family transcriptional regulator n=1 Tax=Bacterioplanoides sp. SCSIO 12839 TaxID=2829569 RepID=UPI0021046736|nr:LysR family transcriptional regulator [Bacterioplanoides sp. SCSIO 12839]UTW49920.1 LysR family transcriptional regulator [Bacterioplanoides sp. SCSIO 12839]
MNYNPHLLDGMVIFSQVAAAGSFTLAAEHTGHSTSYISKEINKLEQRLGVRLMNRTTRSLSLTAEGELYLQQCQQIIADANQLITALAGQQQQASGNLRISCPASFGGAQMQPVFADFLRQYPHITLELDISNRKVDVIAEGFDIVIRATPQLEDSSLISRRVMQSRGITLASPAYLLRKGKPEKPEQLADNHPDQHECITYSHLKQPRLWHYQNRYGKDIQVAVNSRVLTNGSEMILSLCQQGQGIARLPDFLLADQLQTGELVELFPDYQDLSIDVFLIYPSRKHLSAKVRAFIDFVAERFNPDAHQ